MSERSLLALATNVTSACSKFQAVLADEPQAASAPQPSGCQHPSVLALTQLLREHEELLSRLSSSNHNHSNEQHVVRTDEHRDIATVVAKRERVMAQGLNALGSIAVSMRAVLDDVGELVPPDNQYLPSVQELLVYGHRLRYTTFASMGLYSGEPAPQQLHFDHAALWERALAERHQGMAGAAAAEAGAATAPVEPRAEAACRTLLENLVAAGWTPDAGFPEPVLEFLSDMPGAMDVLRTLVEQRFFGGGGGAAASGAAAAPLPQLPAHAERAGVVAAAAPPPANPSSRLVRELMLDEDSDEGGGSSSSGFTSTEDEVD
ncbi:hypothetical protein VOLCADRAFT_97870 [Volvox carteri f. nagariensis]|uniref:Mediator of RNA polymerase II transcription subunit 4 n=1 Tax=Volvox carteri f. nagariensis TaxID=3068 RepID=D8UDV4_VOLCA|nr:uncharacterized protein VOLCADRAFT_97870 [Volvox carteri f. nagariensis]EFJ42157.1 hypothetical protein VOLCADRAFT_97870 [Volvox carteri f. nagariensis]|eukprot:XP_002956854.1 hypothetical protein VOLCADRAFT_97870 [Volvox carteri f. nagariensis]